MLFWLAVTPSSRALIAHSTAGQCSVVKRAPTPSVLWPSLPPVPGKMVERRVVLLDEILQREQVGPGGGEDRRAVGQRGSAVERRAAADSFHAQSPAAFSSSVHSPAFVAKRLFACSVTRAGLRRRPASASQSRQKSGETQGFCAMRRLFVRRN